MEHDLHVKYQPQAQDHEPDMIDLYSCNYRQKAAMSASHVNKLNLPVLNSRTYTVTWITDNA